MLMLPYNPKYQHIEEDWDAERTGTAKGELSWEEWVQFDGQRFGIGT
jgi:hypothetical protein